MQRVNEKNNAKPSNRLKAHAANNPQRAEKTATTADCKIHT